jgi:hypothetical protein
MNGWIRNPADKKQPSGIPVADFAGKLLVHPSQICHIGELDQGLSSSYFKIIQHAVRYYYPLPKLRRHEPFLAIPGLL